MQQNNIYIARVFEHLLPVMTIAEQRRIMAGVVPSVAELDNWALLLRERDNRLDGVFTRAYKNQKLWKKTKTIRLKS